MNEERKVVRNKAKLVAQGHSEQEGINYGGTFAPIARLKSIHIGLSFSTFKYLKLFQINVKSVFLNSFINKGVFVRKLLGF